MNSFFIKAIPVLCCCLIGLHSDSFTQQIEATQDNGKKIRFVIGIDENFIEDIDAKNAVAATRFWIQELANESNFETDVILYKDINILQRDLREGKVDYANSSSLEYLKMKEKVDIEVIFTQMKNNKYKVKYIFVVNTNSSIESIHDAVNKKLIIKKGNSLGYLFLNTLLLRNNADEAGNYFSTVTEARNHTQVVLSVFFAKHDVCIVPDGVYETMVELNPQIGKQLRILETSEEIINNVSFIPKKLNDATKEEIKGFKDKVNTSQRGIQLLTLFQSEALIRIKESDLDTVKQLMDEYNELKNNKKLAERD